METLLATGYAGFLFIAAMGLEWFGRVSHRRSGQFRTAGFKYHSHLDVWECPSGFHLHPHRHDSRKRVTHYRAPAHTCNACPSKPHCTDSDQGREIAHSWASWVESETGRFHRGISLVLMTLAAFILTVELFRSTTTQDRLVLGIALALIASVGQWLARERFSIKSAGAGRRMATPKRIRTGPEIDQM